jgi:ferrous-iron efflux pump FieF
MVLKLAVGITTGSIAVLSDAIDSAEDAIASTFAFLSIRWASQPADEEHPYGHGKAESIAAAAQAVLIAGGAGFIIYQAVSRLIEGDAEIQTTPGLIAMSVTAAVNVGVALYVGRAAKITGSVVLHADTRHLWTNVAQAGAVLLALGPYLLWTAALVFLSAANEIMDTSLPEDEQQQIERCLSEHRSNGVRGFHDLRTRKSGRQRYIDVHVLVDPDATVAEAHDLSNEIEAAICGCLPGSQITVHMEPDGVEGQGSRVQGHG